MSEGGFELIPPKAGVCQECACDHHPDEPHNKDSLYYQYKFHADHDRFPTWEDAMAHCDDEIKEITREVVSAEKMQRKCECD